MHQEGIARLTQGKSNMEKIKAKVNGLNVEALKEMATALMVDMREGSEIVFSVVINRLEQIMPEASFCEFCAELEG